MSLRNFVGTGGTLVVVCALASACGSEVSVEFGPAGSGGAGPASGTGGSSSGAGGTTATTSSVGTGGSGPCGTDCSLIATPQCQVAVCNLDTEQCEVVPDDEGLMCNDGLFCTLDDTCSAGMCVGTTPNTCGLQPLPCNAVTCDESSQTCSQTPSTNGAPCVNPNLCITGSTCQFGQCSGGTLEQCIFFPTPPCQSASCNPNTGVCELSNGPNGIPCVDPNALCTVNQTCLSGACQGGMPRDCSQLDVGCLVGACNMGNGQCFQQAAPNGQTCDDVDSCTSGDICTNGVCGGTAVTQCMNGDGCCPTNCTANNDNDCGIFVRAAIHRGWWRDDGMHTSTNNNTFTGRSFNGDHNAYFIFDLSGITGSAVISAELYLEVEAYFGNDPSEPISLWDVSTPSATLEASGMNVAIYNDLMQGATYGNAVVLSTEVTTIKVFTLNAQAMTDIFNALGGDFSVGVHADDLMTVSGNEAVRWSNINDNEPRVHELHFQVTP